MASIEQQVIAALFARLQTIKFGVTAPSGHVFGSSLGYEVYRNRRFFDAETDIFPLISILPGEHTVSTGGVALQRIIDGEFPISVAAYYLPVDMDNPDDEGRGYIADIEAASLGGKDDGLNHLCKAWGWLGNEVTTPDSGGQLAVARVDFQATVPKIRGLPETVL